MPDLISQGLGDAPDPRTFPATQKESGKPRQAKALNEVLNLLEQITQARQDSQNFRAHCTDIQSRMVQKQEKVQRRVHSLRVAYFHDLGRHLRDSALSRRDREQLLEIVLFLSAEIEEDYGEGLLDDVVRYTGISREELLADAGLDNEADEFPFNEFFKEAFDSAQPEDFREAASEQKHRESSQQNQGRFHSKEKAASQKPTKEADFLGDIRALYLLLARSLHPDKESDAQKRAEKTTWMQAVTTAYTEKNLGALLDILVKNPLGALGPYLDSTPENTLKSFAKRLRRELMVLKKSLGLDSHEFDPRVVELALRCQKQPHAFRTWEKQLDEHVKIFKERAQWYQSLEGVKVLIKLSRTQGMEVLV